MKRLTGYFILAGLYMASAEAAHLSLAVDAASFQYDASILSNPGCMAG